jgi:hypothetical protein
MPAPPYAPSTCRRNVIDDPRVRGSRSCDDRAHVVEIGLGIERRLQRIAGQPSVLGVHDECRHGRDVQGVRDRRVRLIADDNT